MSKKEKDQNELQETATITGSSSVKNPKQSKTQGNKNSKKKKKKKKGGGLIFSFFLLLGVSIWVFWLGWVQLDLPENTYGIIHTKTRGYHPTPVSPEGITWMWEKVIPTNMTIHLFEIKTESITVNEKGELPMADLYASVIEEDVDFSYWFKAKIFYKIDPQSLVGLFENGKLAKDENGRWQKAIRNDITAAIRDTLYKKISNSNEKSSPQIQVIETELSKTVGSMVPEIEIESIQLERYELPGSELYSIAKKRFQERLEIREELRDQLMEGAIVDNENFDQTIKRLEKMGAVLDKYPILLDYFKMNPANGINDFKPQGK